MIRELVLDVETTGLDPSTHKIIEIGIIELYDKTPTGNTFHTYLNPERDIDKEAESVHGIAISFLADKPKFQDIIHELLDFIGNSPIIAHNITFDISFLNKELERCLYPSLINKNIDTLEIARRKYGAVRNSLDALCVRFNISTNRQFHGALKDAYYLSQVYYYMCVEEDTSVLFSNDEFVKVETKFYYRDFSHYLSIEEVNTHEYMMS